MARLARFERATAWFVVISGNINLLFLLNFTVDRPLHSAVLCITAQN